MDKKVWKVVFNDSGKYISAMGNFCEFPENFVLNYQLEKKTIPKIGKIFCFSNISDMQIFVDRSVLMYHKNFVMFLEGIGYNIGTPSYCAHDWKKISTFWERKYKHQSINNRECYNDNFCFEVVPVGTISCSAFLPQKEYTYIQIISKLAGGK